MFFFPLAEECFIFQILHRTREFFCYGACKTFRVTWCLWGRYWKVNTESTVGSVRLRLWAKCLRQHTNMLNVTMLTSWPGNVYHVDHLSLACWHLLINTKHKVKLRLMGMSLILQVELVKFKFWLGDARGKVRGPSKSVGFTLWGTWMSVQNLQLLTYFSLATHMAKIAAGVWNWLSQKGLHA